MGRRPKVVTLGDLFTVRRGLATGNNDFFIVPKDRLRELGIPLDFVRPILPSPRFLRQEVIEADADGWPAIDRQLGLIDCGLSEEEISRKWPRFAKYLQEGKKQGIHEGYLTSRRCPWYSQEKREPAPLLCTYMGRSRERPFRFILEQVEGDGSQRLLAALPEGKRCGSRKTAGRGRAPIAPSDSPGGFL